jgi:hypothetical protein
MVSSSSEVIVARGDVRSGAHTVIDRYLRRAD